MGDSKMRLGNDWWLFAKVTAAALTALVIVLLLRDVLRPRRERPRPHRVVTVSTRRNGEDPRFIPPSATNRVGGGWNEAPSAPPTIDAVESAATQLARAREARRAGAWGELREIANAVLDLTPDSAEAYRLRGQAEMELAFFDDAVESLALAVELPGDDRKNESYAMLAEVKLARSPKDREEAKKLLERAMAEFPFDATVAVMLIELLDRENAEGEIVPLLESLILRLDDPRIEAYHRKWVIDLGQKRAAELARDLAALERSFADGDHRAALEPAARAFARRKSADIGFKLAIARRETGDFDGARDVLRELAPLVGEDTGALAMAALLFAQTELASFWESRRIETLKLAKMNVESALVLAESESTVDAKLRAMSYTYRARCAAFAADATSVDRDHDAVPGVENIDPELVLEQGKSLYILGLTSQDATAFRKAIRRFQDYQSAHGKSSEALYLQGLCYLGLGRSRSDFMTASSRFASARKLGSGNPLLYNAWAETRYRLDDKDRAAELYRESFRLRPTVEACYWSAKYFVESGQKSSAIDVLEEGIRKLATDPSRPRLEAYRAELARA